MASLCYSTSTATAALGWDKLAAQDLASTGEQIASTVVGPRKITLTSSYDADAPSGISYSVEVEYLCTSACREDNICYCSDNDSFYYFVSEVDAFGKYNFCVNYYVCG